MSQGLASSSEEKRAQLAAVLRAKAARARTAPVSFAQQRLWFLSQLEPDSAAYNIPRPLRLRGDLNVAALRQAFTTIVARHEVMRGSFELVGGEPVLVVAPRLEIDLPVVDLEAWPEAAREAEATRLALADAQQPFDLGRAPLLRVSLLRLAAQDHVLLLNMHHIVSDGWSMGILLREVAAIYQAIVAGRSPALPDLPIQYADFARWQRGWLQGPVLDEQVNYWREQLAGAPAVVDLPVARPRPALQSMRGALVEARLSPRLSRGVAELSAREGVTLFMTLLAAFQTLLYRYSSEEDFVVGSPIAGRDRAETEDLIGFFVNALPLRANLTGNPRFCELLARVKETALGAYAHQALPFERIVEELQPTRSLSYPPLFQVMFALQNQPRASFALPGLQISGVPQVRESAKYDLTLFMSESDGGLACRLEYNTDLFDVATATRLLAHFEVLLEGVVARPQQRVADLPLLPAAERQELLTAWSPTRVDYDSDACVHTLFEAQVERTPDAIAVIAGGAEDGWTYTELNRRANQLARHLQTLGTGPEVRVGIFLERTADMIVAVLGVLKAGAAYVPLDPAHPGERVRRAVEDARVRVVVTQERLLSGGAVAGPTAVCLDRDAAQIAAQPSTNLESAVGPDHLAYLIYTSGSTGTPKGVQIEHRALTNLLCAMRVAPGLAATDVLVSVTTLSFDIAALELYLPLIVGARLVIASQDQASDGRRLWERLAETGATVMQATPATWRMLIEAGWEGSADLRALCGGEQLTRELADQILSRVRALWNLYGPTETTIWSAAARVEAGSGPVLIAGPVANTQLYVLDAQLAPVPEGVVGELYIGGDGLARGYWQDPELTAQRFLPNPFATRPGARLYRTGDRVRASDGSIVWLGRVDHQIKLRGFRIELGEIEAVIRSHPLVSDAVVVVSEDEPGDARLVAYLVARTGEAGGTLVPDVRRILAGRLPRHMLPSAFVVLEAWPLTANGKINRRALPPPDDARPDLQAPFVPPRSEAEAVLARIWADVLKVDRIGVHDDFFQLGGHSLRAIQVVSRVREQFGIELPLRALFEHATVGELAEAIAASRPVATPLTAISRSADTSGPVPVSFAQQRLWFLGRLEPDSATYNMPRPLRLRGDLEIAALRQALNGILARHGVLRGGFDVIDDKPVQVIAPSLEIELPIVDLESWPEAERDGEVRRRALADAQHPFDLTRAPLLRASLLRLGPREHILLLNIHHIASDGWSMGILLRELAAIYQATVEGRPAALPDLPVQYADFARWQRAWLQGPVLDEQVEYWRKQLAGAPPVLDLPIARARPALQSTQGAVVAMTLPPRLTRDLSELSAREGVTLFMTLLSAFQTLLYRYSGQEDFVVGSPIAGRDRAETEDLIGFFVNALPLRASLAGNPRFCDLLARVKETALGAYAHQALPFERIVEEVQPTRSLSYPPIFQVMFALQNQPRVAFSLPGLHVTAVPQVRESAKYDLTLFVAQADGRLWCQLEYNTDLFDAATATRLLGHFEVLLDGLVARPQQRVADLPLLAEEERQQLLTTWNQTTDTYDQSACIQELFEAQVEQTPGAVAVIDDDAPDGLTYAEVNSRANHLAHRLRTLGVGPEVLVGIFMTRSVDMIVALLAVLKAGGAYVPLDPAYPPERVRFSLEDARVPVVLTDSRVAERLPRTDAHIVCVDRAEDTIARADGSNPLSAATAANLAYVIYTSGSTGQPKGVAIAHGSAVALVQWAQRTFTSAELAGVLASTSICFDLSVFEIFVPLSVGGTVIVAADALQLPEAAAQARVTLVNTVPSAMAELVRLGLPATVQTVNLAGEPLRTELVAEIYRQPSVRRVVDLYGPSEDTTYSTYAVRQPDEPPTIGRPIANTRVYILDAALAPVPIGVPGEIYLAGAGLARGYLGRPAATAERFLPDPFSGEPGGRLYRTGDLGRYGTDGRIAYFGRIDHQVKIRGYRIELGEIETAIRRHPDIDDAVVLAREDTPGDKRLVAYVVAVAADQQAGKTTDLSTDLRTFLRATLPEYMVPGTVVVMDALPLTANGKVDRRALMPPDRSAPASRPARSGPRDHVERQLAEIWAKVLDLDSIGIEDNFFDVGGHSLLAVRLMSEIEKALGQRIPLAALFQDATISALAALLRRDVSSISWPTLVPIQHGGARPPLFCVSRPGVNALGYRSLARYLGGDQPVYGLQSQHDVDLNGEFSQAAVERVADEYLEAIRLVQPTGPYQLLGQCRGAHIAFEIARRLQAEGQHTALLGILDTWVLENTLKTSWYINYRLKKLAAAVRRMPITSPMTFVKALRGGTVATSGARDPVLEVYFPGPGFNPKTYAGRVAVFRAREQPRYRIRDNSLGWATLVPGGVEIYDIPGTHSTVLSEPHVQGLAGALNGCLLAAPAQTPLPATDAQSGRH